MIPGFGLAVALAFVLQAAPAAQPTLKASLSGIVVDRATGNPVPGVRVTIARTDRQEAATALAEYFGLDRDAPTVETVFPIDFFETIISGIGLGADISEDDPPRPEATLLKTLPLEQIHSILFSPNGKAAFVPKDAPPVLTDGGGRFAFPNLAPGAYRLIFAANGFVRQDYGQALTGTPPSPITLSAGKNIDGLVMRLTRTGAISGRVTDSAGQPVPSAPVQLACLVYDARAKKTAKTIASTYTDDRGEYRFYFLTPGRYYLSAGGGYRLSVGDDVPPLATPSGQVAANRAIQYYDVSFYRDATEIRSATPIEVAPGAELPDLDLIVASEQTYAVRGSVVDFTSGRPPGEVYLSMTPAEGETVYTSSPEQHYDPASGTFELKRLRPGSYLLIANLPDDWRSKDSIPADKPFAAMIVKVDGADVDGVSMRVAKGVSVSGRIRADANTGPEPALSGVRVTLALESPAFEGDPLDFIEPDGKFQFDRLIPADYRLTVSGLPPGFYLKSARWGDTDALNGPVTVTAKQNPNLEITIAFGMGQISGTATAAGAQVVLVPAPPNRMQVERFQSVTAEANGRFNFASVAPGDYHLVSVKSMELFGYFDPALIRQAEEKGKPVHVGESSKQNIDVPTN